MSDGYWAYRELDQRLRCLPHVMRKARGLEEGFDTQGRELGHHVLDVLATVMQAVYEARGAPPNTGLRARHAPLLNGLLEHCLRLVDCPYEKTRALARELLNDWDTFWVVLDHPELPLSNNEAERALRDWVIARRSGMGTRTPQGATVLGFGAVRTLGQGFGRLELQQHLAMSLCLAACRRSFSPRPADPRCPETRRQQRTDYGPSRPVSHSAAL